VKESSEIIPVVDVSSLIAKATGKVTEKGVKTYSITITVTHIRNNKGSIRFKFYDDSTPFPHDTGILRVVIPKSEIDLKDGAFTVSYDGFVSKNMAIALSDDENDNVDLDMGWLLPKEGHAFSDYHHTALRRPVYKDFDFFLDGDKHVIMKMKYY
jgi:uncharacterized protein (DUF2141 family)